MSSTIQHHLAFPNVSVDRHMRDCQVGLAKGLETRKSIYLDLKFWIALRKAESGESNNPSCQDLLQHLRDLVSSGKVFCPISDSTFLEIFKQSDPSTRRATTDLVDELSLGVSLIPSQQLMNTEVAHFFNAVIAKHDVDPLRHLVWTKLSYVLGAYHPSCSGFDHAAALAIQKAFVDHMWTMSLSDMDSFLRGQMPPRAPFEDLASRMNEANACHASGLRSFPQTYQIELEGVLDLCAEPAAAVMNTINALTGKSVAHCGAAWEELKRDCFARLLTAFKNEATKDTLRTIHIQTCLHASVRWDKKRLFKENDFMDFQHAVAALGYCDAFFTERSLGTMIKRPDIALDTRYACHVGITAEDALAYLESNF